MFRSFLKTGLRNLWRSKGFSALNICGLAIGMASAMIILLWVQNELSYDRFYPKIDRLYQAWNRDKWDDKLECWNSTPKIMAPSLKLEYPEIEKASRVNWNQNLLFNVGEKNLYSQGTMVDPDFLTMFSWPFEQGDPNTALNNPTSIILTKKLAKKLFGNGEAIGKVIKIDNKDNFTVSGVMKDLPNNTGFNFEYLLPWTYMVTRNQMDSSWWNNSTRTYVQLNPKTQISALNTKIKNVTKTHCGQGQTTEVFLYPVKQLRLHGEFTNGVPTGGRIEMVRVFIIIAVFILLIACINFMNLSTARSEKRAKEVGIRKVSGALKGSLIGQFLFESVMISIIAGILALVIVQLCLPSFNILTRKQLGIAYSDIYFWLSFLGFILFTGILAGSYPAFFLSSFKPVMVLKGSFKKVNALITPRKVLVVLQFTFAIILIICTIIIQQQIKYAQSRENGYDKGNLVFINMAGEIEKSYKLIANDLLRDKIAVSISKTSSPITDSWSNTWGFKWEGKAPTDKTIVNVYCSDGDLVKTTGMKIVKGRDINLRTFLTDSFAAVINEAAAKAMSFKNPIGQNLRYDTNYHVIGVVKDFIMESPYEPIRPIVVMGPHNQFFNTIHIKLNKENSTAKNIAGMEKIFKQYNPQYPFEYKFVDEAYAEKFASEQVTGSLAGWFSFLTIFISCLGLFGLATYMAQNRIKEIGVRKVLGASVTNITTLLSKDFLKLVVLSLIIASPVAWYAMFKWLEGFKYHTPINWWIFIMAGSLALLIAFLTVSYQAIRAALMNPAKSLRSE
jgi:putative ABC transport system permease protein